ncbi:MAG: DUF4129 domain-containing protein [Bacteroidota bacterium]
MRSFVLLLFFTFCFAEIIGQDQVEGSSENVVQYDTNSEVSPISFSEESIDQFKNDDSFDYTEQKDQNGLWAQFKRWLSKVWHSFWNWLLGDYEGSGFWSFFVGVLPYLIIAALIAFIIWLFYKLNPGARLLKGKEAPGIFFTEEEEIVRTKDIKKLIAKALEQQDYRLAVRYYYLLILKKLSEAEIIEYMFDKTNNDYIAEIAPEKINRQFQKVTGLYDYIWYGNFEVTATDFSVAQETFDHLEHQIPNSVD